MKTNIFVVSHKIFNKPKDNLYKAIYVGNKIIDDREKTLLKDNSKDNIEKKNSSYCELTAVYWLWKNYNEIENIGICHYRRYFSRKVISKSEKHYINNMDIISALNNYDIIVPQKWWHSKYTNSENYYIHGAGKKKDLIVLRKIIEVKYPQYIVYYDRVLNMHAASYCNMLITTKETYDNYCNWLFDILFEAEKQIDISNYNKTEARVFGYMSELLLNVWILKNNLKVKEVNMVNTETTSWYNLKFYISNQIQKVKCRKYKE